MIFLEKLATQINDTSKKFLLFHKLNPKMNKLQINNVILNKKKYIKRSNKINYPLES